MWDKGLMAKATASTVQEEREDMCAALQYAARFHCFVEELTDSEELKPQSEENLIFVDKKGNEASNGVVCSDRCA